MIIKYLNSLILGITIIAVLASSITAFIKPSFAQSEEKEDPDKGLPKSGVLSNSYSGTAGQTNSIPIPWNREGTSPESEAPISGSVSRNADKKWSAKTFNNSDDSFDVSIKVKQLGKAGNVIHSDYFSFRLKPKQSIERSINAFGGAVDAQLELSSWKRIPSAKTAANSSDVSKENIEPEKLESPKIQMPVLEPSEQAAVANTPTKKTRSIIPQGESKAP